MAALFSELQMCSAVDCYLYLPVTTCEEVLRIWSVDCQYSLQKEVMGKNISPSSEILATAFCTHTADLGNYDSQLHVMSFSVFWEVIE